MKARKIKFQSYDGYKLEGTWKNFLKADLFVERHKQEEAA
jgi:hypothetical protein